MSTPSLGATPGGGDGKKRARAQNIVPMTVADVRDNTEESVSVEGLEVGMVVLVGQVKRIDQQATKTIYTVEDNSGSIDAVHWSEVSALGIAIAGPRDFHFFARFCLRFAMLLSLLGRVAIIM
jgi:hypothetical protein